MKSIGQISSRPWLVSTVALMSLSAFGLGCSDKDLGNVLPGQGGHGGDAGITADAGQTGGAGMTADVGPTADTGPTADVGPTLDTGPTPDAGNAACGTSSMVMVAGKPTGYGVCDGVIHRAQKTTCPNLLPRAQVAHQAGVASTCNTDADCTAKPNGYCTFNSGFISSSYFCAYGCVNDSDCGSGFVCQCGDPVGTCTATTSCTTDADCVAGKLCAAGSGDINEAGGTCELRFACQTAADKCKSQADCAGGGREYCAISSTGRKCVTTPQDAPCF